MGRRIHEINKPSELREQVERSPRSHLPPVVDHYRSTSDPEPADRLPTASAGSDVQFHHLADRQASNFNNVHKYIHPLPVFVHKGQGGGFGCGRCNVLPPMCIVGSWASADLNSLGIPLF
jgi:hypothetical protein